MDTFWEFDSDVPILFSEVKHKAIALYFDVITLEKIILKPFVLTRNIWQ